MMPPHLQEICGCEMYIIPKVLHTVLNKIRKIGHLKYLKTLLQQSRTIYWQQIEQRVTIYKQLAVSNNQALCAALKQAASSIYCPPPNNKNIIKMYRMQWFCTDYPQYNITVEEQAEGPNSLATPFDRYKTIMLCCTWLHSMRPTIMFTVNWQYV